VNASSRKPQPTNGSVENDDPFARMLDILLPQGGYVVAQVECYFDESGSHSGSHALCVAGYLMDKRSAIALTRQWAKVLKRVNIPYFHMVDCAHGTDVFEKLSITHRIDVEKKMIDLIKEKTIQGIGVTINMQDYNSIMPKHPLIGTPYSFCAHVLIAGVGTWLQHNVNADPPIKECAFFFEAGHQSMTETNRIMEILFLSKTMRERHKYAGHAFVLKEKTPAVQAADLLAWQLYTDRRHEMENRPRRKDYESLLQHHHTIIHLDKPKIMALAERFGFEPPNSEAMEQLRFGDLHDG
jgi:Protein of unknown function (DUF3800)